MIGRRLSPFDISFPIQKERVDVETAAIPLIDLRDYTVMKAGS
jgi:hypothetical protein